MANSLMFDIQNIRPIICAMLREKQEKMRQDNSDIKIFYEPFAVELSAKLIDTGDNFKKNSNLDDNLIF